jgi:hypothetical protein
MIDAAQPLSLRVVSHAATVGTSYPASTQPGQEDLSFIFIFILN